MELFVVTADNHLYEDRVGSLVWQDKMRVQLDLGDDKVLFDRNEVERII